MIKDNGYIDLLNCGIKSVIDDALKVSLKNPSVAKFLIKTAAWQKKSEKIRDDWEKKGTHVPPFIIASITNRCNLKCKGCFAHAHNRKFNPELEIEDWERIFSESHELGISFILLAGGEPFIRKDIIALAGKYPDMIFPVFTNAMLINDDVVSTLSKFRNIIPILSIEGYENETDSRRGQGVYERLLCIMDKLKSKDIFFGTSITITSDNFNTVTGEDFVNNLMERTCKIVFYVEYVPIEKDTDTLTLSDEQNRMLLNLLDEYRVKFSSLFIAFPGDEERMGGCLASGRGFVHISSEGNLEPCPFSPYSDTNLKNASLRAALNSPLLEKIREDHDRLSEHKGGCALYENKDWVVSLLHSLQK